MKIVCSWCRQEGGAEFVGEKPPFDDARETHGICVMHRRQVQIHWQEMVYTTGSSRRQEKASSSWILAQWTELLNITKKVHQ